MNEVYRCPECGYTQDDAALHMDHHICEAKGGPPMPPRGGMLWLDKSDSSECEQVKSYESWAVHRPHWPEVCYEAYCAGLIDEKTKAKELHPTSNLTFSEVLEAMMATPLQRWTCSALHGKNLYCAFGYFWERNGTQTSKFRLESSVVLATDWQVVEKSDTVWVFNASP